MSLSSVGYAAVVNGTSISRGRATVLTTLVEGQAVYGLVFITSLAYVSVFVSSCRRRFI